MDSFSNYNPRLNFIYFSFIIIVNMFFLNPIIQALSLIVGLVYLYILKEGELDLSKLGYFLGLILATAIFNMLFNHKGESILFYLYSGNPATLEAIVYGLSSAFMLINMIVWFSCYTRVMDSDKFNYIFARHLGSVSLVLSMVLRFLPNYIDRLRKLKEAEIALGEGSSEEGLMARMKNSMKLFSILTTWALENSIDSSDSMKARGYGLAKRTSFSNYRMAKRDWIVLFFILGLMLVTTVSILGGDLKLYFFPRLYMASLTRRGLVSYLAYFFLLVIPIILNIREAIKWRYLQWKI